MHLPSYIDGGPLDIITLLVAIVIAVAKCYRHNHALISKEMGFNVVHGIAIFPLFVLSLAVFNKELIAELAKGNSLILSVAGVVALLSILEEEFKKNGDTL